MQKSFPMLVIFSAMLLIPIIQADASNANLFVSAENPKFNNHFSGSMVVEVVIRDANLQDTDEGKGEPDVTINGKTLRMVQAVDGNWYAYFANVDMAKAADSTVGLPGEGLDFGVFCSRDTSSSVFGISLSETDGFAVPNSGLSAFTNGDSSFVPCTGIPDSSNQNNVVRNPRSINTNPNIPPGQIGLNSNAWPLIQLYSFSDVTIQYNAAGGLQTVNLEYDEIPNISFNVDRNNYPQNSQVFLTVNDFQLNQDPTDQDSWTFNIDSPTSTFYQAFDSNGSDSANGNLGLVNLSPFLSNLGFEDNGSLFINLGNIMGLTQNSEQPETFVTDGPGGNTFQHIVTLVEDSPNSGLFDNADNNDESTITILSNAPRGQSGQIEYNEESLSVLTGLSTASVSVNKPSLTIGDNSKTLVPGTKFPVILADSDQNLNSGARDHLDVFRDSSLLPTLKIGNPITLEQSSNVKFYASSTDALTAGDSAISSILDKKSARLFIDTSPLTINNFEKISINLGIASSGIKSTLIDNTNSANVGTNWINYDLRSFQQSFGLTNFSDTSIMLYFGSLSDPSPITIIDSGDLSSSQGFVELDDVDVKDISMKNGSVFIVINFDSSDNDVPNNVGTISNIINKQPIILDFFSFGLDNKNNGINNSIFRFELEETSDNSSAFKGTLEYSVTNQLNILDENFIKTIRPISNQIKFIVTDRLIDEEGIFVSYSDLDKIGITTTTSAQSDIQTNSGTVTIDSQSYRFGQPITFTLNDPDLNLKNDNVDIYVVIDDPNSPFVDTVGKDGNVLLEILIKDIRYKRCTINGVSYGGLASTGFTLVETGPATGIFAGSFKMPSQICDKSGTKLISSAGGSIDVKYFDSRDSSGKSNVFSLLKEKSLPVTNQPQLSKTEILLPSSGETEEIILSGSVNNHKRGLPLEITLVHPDGITQNFGAVLSESGSYRAAFSLNENSLTGVYKIHLSHNSQNVGSVSFTASSTKNPDWVKDNAKKWSNSSISNSEFLDGLEQMIKEKVISVSPMKTSPSERIIPEWVKNNAKWWSTDKISENDFIKSIQYLIKRGIIRV
jgi:hypothetical protein